MALSVSHTLFIFLICAACTVFSRALPFIIFRGKEVPNVITYLGGVLPMAIMATLVIYCIKSISFATPSGWLPYIISIGFTAGAHLWLKNALISITGGTVLYMILVQMIFA